MLRNLIGGLILSLVFVTSLSASPRQGIIDFVSPVLRESVEVAQPYDLLPPDSISIILMKERITKEGKDITAYFPSLDLAKNLEYSMPWTIPWATDHDSLHSHVPPMIRIGNPYQEGIVTIFLREFDGFISWRTEQWQKIDNGFLVFLYRFSPHGVWRSVYIVGATGGKMEEVEPLQLIEPKNPLWHIAVVYSELAWQVLGQTYPIHNMAP